MSLAQQRVWGWGTEAKRVPGWGLLPGPSPTGSPRVEGEEWVLFLGQEDE